MAPLRHDAAQRVAWADFLDAFDWRQGEHVSLIGPTGGGKTTLALEILPRRAHVAVLGTKPRDPTLDRLRGDGYRVIREWPPEWNQNRVILWPRMRRIPDDIANQQTQFDNMLRRVFAEEGWCVYVDELHYLCDVLRLQKHLAVYWQQGRSIGLSLVASAQRPASIPLAAYSQATHLFFWRTNDDRDLKRIGGIGGLSSKEIAATVAALPRHDVLYVNSRTGAMSVTRVEKEGS